MNACPHCDRPGRFYRDKPKGYVAWHKWAEKMSRTHHQEPCPGCGRFTVWRKGAADPACPDCGMTAQVEPSRKQPGRFMCHGCGRYFDAPATPGDDTESVRLFVDTIQALGAEIRIPA